MKIWFLIFAVVLAMVRFTLPATHLSFSGSYQAVAHLFVGGLLGAYFANRKANEFCLLLAIALSSVEILAAFITRI